MNERLGAVLYEWMNARESASVFERKKPSIQKVVFIDKFLFTEAYGLKIFFQMNAIVNLIVGKSFAKPTTTECGWFFSSIFELTSLWVSLKMLVIKNVISFGVLLMMTMLIKSLNVMQSYSRW